jgi:S1-C subfamily serine protease
VTLSPNRQLRITPSYLVAAETHPGSVGNGGSLELSVPPPSAAAGAIVDLDGELVGMAVETDDGMRVHSSQAVLQMMARLQGNRKCHAIEVSDLDAEVHKLLRVRNGVLVERVSWDSFRPEPSIHPGDVLIEWDGRRLSNRWDFHQSYEQQEAGKLVRYRLLRGQRVLTGATVMPGNDCRPLGEPLIAFPTLGITVRWGTVPVPEGQPPQQGFRVIAVAPGSPAADAGLFIDDWLIATSNRKLAESTARKTFDAFERRPRPLLLTVQRGDRVRLLAVAPPAEEQG